MAFMGGGGVSSSESTGGRGGGLAGGASSSVLPAAFELCQREGGRERVSLVFFRRERGGEREREIVEIERGSSGVLSSNNLPHN
jgi:hypothetical protein